MVSLPPLPVKDTELFDSVSAIDYSDFQFLDEESIKDLSEPHNDEQPQKTKYFLFLNIFFFYLFVLVIVGGQLHTLNIKTLLH